MPAFVLRHGTSCSHKVLTGSPQFVTSAANEIRNRIVGDDFFARHRSLFILSASLPRHYSVNQKGVLRTLAAVAAT